MDSPIVPCEKSWGTKLDAEDPKTGQSSDESCWLTNQNTWDNNFANLKASK